MITVKKLKDDLDYWIHIGIGDDIVRAPDSRPEYQHLVRQGRERNLEDDHIPDFVLGQLKYECEKFVLFRPTFWRLNYLYMKWGCKWLSKKGSQGLQILAGKKEV